MSSVVEKKVIDMAKKNFVKRAGSALILVVVLTSLLAILGVMFVLSSRVEKITASAISANKELDFAVDSVVAAISQRLAADVPNGDPNIAYYDYPDAQNPWLANLEPYQYAVNDFRWRQISDIYHNPLTGNGLLQQLGIGSFRDKYGYIANPYLLVARIINPNDPVGGVSDGTNTVDYGGPADADGDGVADSRWIQIPDITSSKGKPVYAAARVIDNSAMLNVNTAYLFDPNEIDSSRVDGSRQTQINLTALSQRGANGTPALAAVKLQTARCGSATPDIAGYESQVVWNYGQQFGAYTPFDISDELKLRNRYILNDGLFNTRIEPLWTYAYNDYAEALSVPVDGINKTVTDWFNRATYLPTFPKNYDYRHISTTYNMDRIIDPNGWKMLNVKTTTADQIYQRMLNILTSDPNFVIPTDVLAQMAANIEDYSDNDSNVSVVDVNGMYYYGFERPCIFLSELARYFIQDTTDPTVFYKSFAIELQKRYYPAANTDQWYVVISDPPLSIPITDFGQDASRYRVIIFQDANTPLLRNSVLFSDSPENEETGVDPNVVLRWAPVPTPPADANYTYDVYFGTDYNNVIDANNAPGMWPEFKGNQSYGNTSYDPVGSLPLDTSRTYFWRIDDKNGSGNVVGSTGVWQFTTWAVQPGLVYRVGSEVVFNPGSIISVERRIRLPDGTDANIVVDSVAVPNAFTIVDLNNVVLARLVSWQRDTTVQRWIKRLWSNDVNGPATLGSANTYEASGFAPLIAYPRNDITNIGEIGIVLRKNAYITGPADDDSTAKIDLTDPSVQKLFKYLTVIDPGLGETRIKGRININTAPWYVIAQLPWVSQRRDVPSNYDPNALAQAIVAYRDKLNLSPAGPDYYQGGDYFSRKLETAVPNLRENPGFESIGELATVTNTSAFKHDYDIHYYALDGNDLWGYPDLTAGGERRLGDGSVDDFKERDVIFARISNLVTVRSDVFTAYILVRAGNNGPQKRVIVILDRSEVIPGVGGKVKVIAVHPVPDPR